MSTHDLCLLSLQLEGGGGEAAHSVSQSTKLENTILKPQPLFGPPNSPLFKPMSPQFRDKDAMWDHVTSSTEV